ncbi:MAG: hypothetical protein QOI95_2171 [Acidimicrobiaceae bacterium]|jgi:hypothetical protein
MTETDDVVSLWRLQAQYADIVTRRAWAELHEVFRPDTLVEVDTVTNPVRVFIGADAFGEFVGDSIERFDHFEFVILNTVVDITSGTKATGRIFMCEIRHDRELDTWPIAYGRYEDSYSRVDGRWWFTERRYRSMARTGPDAAIFGLPI